MQIDIDDEELETFILTGNAKSKKYKKLKANKRFLIDLNKVMALLRRTESCSLLSRYASLNYEPLKYDLSGFSSVRIGYKSKYRLIFEKYEEGIRIKLIEISEHYGDK